MKNSSIIAIDLLLLVYPELSPYYLKVLKLSKNPVERFDELVKQASLVVHNKRELWQYFRESISVGVDVEEFICKLSQQRELREVSPKKALKILENIHSFEQKEIEKNMKLFLLENLLVDKNATDFYHVQNKKIVSGYEKLLRQIVEGKYSAGFYGLDFQGYHCLRKEQLLKVLQNSSSLARLNISDCSELKLDIAGMASITQYCQHLNWLNISKNVWLTNICMPNLLSSSPLKFSALKYLDVSFCQQLVMMKMQAPQLQNLKAKSCEKLEHLLLESNALIMLDLSCCHFLIYKKVIISNIEKLVFLELQSPSINQASRILSQLSFSI